MAAVVMVKRKYVSIENVTLMVKIRQTKARQNFTMKLGCVLAGGNHFLKLSIQQIDLREKATSQIRIGFCRLL